MIWFGRNSSGTQSGERKRQCRDRSFHDSAGQATPDGHERTTRRPNSFNAARLHNPRSTAAAQLQHKTQKPAQKARCESTVYGSCADFSRSPSRFSGTGKRSDTIRKQIPALPR